MGIFDRFPYSSTHEMNLDFMLGKATEIAESLQEIDTHKDQAEQAATNAAQSAQSAAQAAQAAAGSQTAAGTSASQAAQHKADAEDAADRAEAASDLADEAVEQAQTAANGAIASAAAAESRINALAASLPEDFTELNEEVNNLKSDLIETTNLSSEYTQGRVTAAVQAGTAISPLNNTSTSFAGIVVPCKKGDTFVISGTGGTTPRLWGFAASDLKAINWADAEITVTNLSLVAQQDGYFISNAKYTDGYTYSLTMTRQMTYTEKISDITKIISLLEFGAKGDGVTDDTAAINNALTNATGKTLIIPEGTYLFSETLNVKSNTRIVGFGAGSILKLANTFTLTPYNWRTGEDLDPYRYPMIAIEENGHDCIMENFTLQGQTNQFLDKNCEGIYIRGNNHKINKLIIKQINYFPSSFAGRTANGVGYGIRVGEASNVIIDGCYINECGYQSIGIEDSQNVTVSNNYCGDANQTGMQVHRLSKRVRLENNTVEFSAGINNVSLTLHANVGLEMEDIHINNNSFCSGITFVGGGETNIMIVDNAAAGGLTMNGQTRRKNIFVRGNKFDGGITGYYENAVIESNMITNNTGGRMINVNGTNIVCAHNIPLGTGQSTAINDIPVQQWAVNPAL